MMRVMKNSSGSSFSRALIVAFAALLLFVTNCGGAHDSGANQPATDGDAQTAAPVSANDATTRRSSDSQSSPGAERRSGVLIDYRKEKPDHAPPRLDEGLRRRIVEAAYGANAAPKDYSVNSSASGSFTERGARETVYLIERGGPVASDPNGAQDLALVVFDATGQLVAKFKTSDFNFIAATADADGDGVSELLLEGSFLNMGTLGSSARLVELKSKRLRLVKTFEGVYENPCEGYATSQVTAAVVNYAADGNPPTFKVDFYRAPCPANGGDPTFDSFKPSEKP